MCAPRAPNGTTHPLALWEAWDGPLSIIVNVAVPDQERELSRLRLKRSMAHLQRLNPLGQTNPEHAVLSQELDTLFEHIARTREPLAWARTHIVLWGDQARLPQGIEAVARAGRQFDLAFLPEPILGSTLFLSTLPLGFDPEWPKESVICRARRLPVSQITHLLPLYGGFRGTRTASTLYLNQRGEIVNFDPFDAETAAHGVIIGKSGSGKSFAIAHLVQQVLPLGASVVILDHLPSYKTLCAAWNGTYLAMDLRYPICFNAFYGPLDKDHVAFLAAFLAEMASGRFERLTQEAFGVLADALAYFAETWDCASGEATLMPFVREVLQTGIFAPDDIEAQRLGKELARKLSPYYSRGIYAGVLDGVNTFRLDQRLTVIELSELDKAPDLQAIILFAVMHLLTQFYAAPERLHTKKYFVAEESWSLLRHPKTAEVMDTIVRTYRKLTTSAWFLSQKGKDFDSPAGQTIRANADAVLFLQQEASELAKIKELFELSEAEAALIGQAKKHPGWSSAYLRLHGNEGGLIRLIPDAHTRWLVSQDSRERTLREQAFAETGGDLRQAIATLAQRYPYGLGGGHE